MRNAVKLVVAVVLLAGLALGVMIPRLADGPGRLEASNMPPAMREDLPAGAYTTLTVQDIVNTGLAPAYSSAASGGNQFVNDGKTFLHIKNTNAAVRAITVTTPVTIQGLAVGDVNVSIPATTGDKMIGPFPTSYFNYSGALTKVDFSAVADVTIAAIRLP